MHYVGLDVSLRSTGLVVLAPDGRAVDYRVIGWPAKQEPCDTVVSRIGYYNRVGSAVRLALLNLSDEVAICVEGYSMHSKGNLTIAPELGGLVRLGLLPFGRIHEVPPSVLKKFATGKGNATKDVVMKEVLRRWDFNTDDNNIADAYVLARMARAHYHQVDDLTVPQREALAVVFGG